MVDVIVAGDEQCSEKRHVLQNSEAALMVVRAYGRCLQRFLATFDLNPKMD